jgi:hypothetical protein
VKFQLRDHTIEEGHLDDFVREWREHLLPLRVAMGFNILGPWIERETSRFILIVGFDGDFHAAGELYRASSERQAIDPDPARFITETRRTWLQAP